MLETNTSCFRAGEGRIVVAELLFFLPRQLLMWRWVLGKTTAPYSVS